MKLLFGLFGLLFTGPFVTHATVTLSTGQVASLRDDSGSAVAVGRVALLVADFSNDGLLNLGGTFLSEGNYLAGGTDDQILAVGFTSEIESGIVGYNFSGTTFDYSGNFGTGDNLYVLWLPTISNHNIIVAAGLSYGQYRSGIVDAESGSDIAWIAPADGGAYSLAAFDTSINPSGIASPGDLTASLTTSAVPEPATYAALFGLAAVGFCAWRKRRVA